MSTMSQFFTSSGGGVPGVPSSIVNGFSSGNPVASFVGNTTTLYNQISLDSGALTANTLQTVLSITGKGRLGFVGARSGNATSRTIRLKITLDGVVAFDSTTPAFSATNQGIIAIGSISFNSGVSTGWIIPSNVYFKTSALVEVASSLTETSLVNVPVMYEVYQ
jgi:hypothetical protein